MGQSNGTAPRGEGRKLRGIIATCDHCEGRLNLMMTADGEPPSMVCEGCRVFYPLAEILGAMRKYLRRRRQQGS